MRATAGSVVVCGSAHPSLGAAVAAALAAPLVRCNVERFPDGELHVELTEPVCDRTVVLVQPTIAPAGESLLELCLLADAARRAYAERIVGVVPYFGYARQDRRKREGEPLAGRVAADVLETAGLASILSVDLHAPSVEGFFATPMAHVTAVPLLARAVREHIVAPAVVVAPDLGAVKLARAYARVLGLPMAIVHKTRLDGSTVSVEGVIGDVRGRRPVIVDDMISTGGTIIAALHALLLNGAEPDVLVAATHGLFVGGAVERLGELPIRRVVVTDTVPTSDAAPLARDIVPVAPLIAEALRRIEGGRGLAEWMPER